jgi:hypothetical protein
MSHSIGRLVTITPEQRIGPDSGAVTPMPPVWEFLFTSEPAVEGGTPRFVILHFMDMSFPAGTRLEVDVRYGKDVFTVNGGTRGQFSIHRPRPNTSAALTTCGRIRRRLSGLTIPTRLPGPAARWMP